MTPLDLIALRPVMARTIGIAEVTIGVIDGPVARNHPGLANARVVDKSGRSLRDCAIPGSAACFHGTFIAGILSADRDSLVPGICPGCTLFLRPVFVEASGVEI